MKPLVSIIIPTYNCAAFVAESVRSALAQTYRPIEVIVVDDGSTDDTRDRLKAFGGDIRYIHQENAGAGAARNRGAAEAGGDFIAVLDADDTCAPDRVEAQLKLMLSDDRIGLVTCMARYVNYDATTTSGEWGSEQPPQEPDARPLRTGPEGWVFDHSVLPRLVRSPFLAPGTLLMHREQFLALGGYDTSLARAEDYDLLLRFAQTCRIGHVARPLYNYRKGREDSLTTNRMKLSDSIIKTLEKVARGPFGRQPEVRRELRRRIAAKHALIGALHVKDGATSLARPHFLAAVRAYPRPTSAACLVLAWSGPVGRPLLRRLARRIAGESPATENERERR